MNHDPIPRARAAGIALLLWAAGTVAAGAAERPVIVELYTSEGCSSCPPADAIVEELAKRPDVLPIAFHVDYWDGLGWRDRWSMKEATARQQDLGRALGLSTVGTPQMIVEGQRSVSGANQAALIQALKGPQENAPLEAQRVEKDLVVRVPARGPRDTYDVYVIGYLPQAVTPIQRGENAGRTLTEVNVVRSIRRLGVSGDKAREWKVAVDSFPRDASRVLVLLQRPKDGPIAGARTVELR
jgi:hypothetical protein